MFKSTLRLFQMSSMSCLSCYTSTSIVKAYIIPIQNTDTGNQWSSVSLHQRPTMADILQSEHGESNWLL